MARPSQPSVYFPPPPNSGSMTKNVRPVPVSLNKSAPSIPRDGVPTIKEKKSRPSSPLHTKIGSSFRQGCKRITNDPWVLEYVAAILAILAVVALITVLAQASDRPQQSFTMGDTRITLNTVVAAISTVNRAALLVTVGGALSQSPWNWFSSSSRKGSELGRRLEDLDIFGGASSTSWGSLRLLWRTKFRNFASIGAALTILSLGFDTFAQQILIIEPSNVPIVVSNATQFSPSIIPRTEVYSANDPTDFTGVPLDVQGAVYAGFFNSNVSLLAPVCQTGNCTWPVTPSVGVCGSCGDIRSKLFHVQSSQNLSYGLPLNLIGNGVQTLQATLVNGTLDNTFTVTNNFVDAAYGITNRSNIAEFFAFGLSPMSLSNLLSKLEVDPDITSLNDYMMAYSCKLYFCVQAYKVSTTEGKPSQTVVGTWAQTKQVAGDPAINFTNVPPEMNPRNGPFSIQEGAHEGLANIFAQVLAGRVFQGGPENNDALLFLPGISDDKTFAPGLSSFIHAVYDASNSTASMDALVQQMSTVLTNHIRGTFPAPADARYVGTVFGTELFVRVRWAWLTYPLCLLVASLGFLAATVWQTSRRGVKVWKGSLLPLLVADLDEVVKRRAEGAMENLEELEKRVGALRVVLENEGRGNLMFRVP